MKIISTNFSGLKVIQSINYRDSRGYFKEDFKQKFFKNKKFVFGCTSTSNKNVMRGLHLQTRFPQGKYISILKGAILDVAVDLRKKSKTYGKHFKIILSSDNAKSIFIPEGFAHGFVGLKNENIIHYLCTNYRSAKNEIGLLWNDKNLKIKWPIKNPIISKKDKKNLTFQEFKNLF
jgi:dTDP-4-dehydrorhamnose 3,5-epimerase